MFKFVSLWEADMRDARVMLAPAERAALPLGIIAQLGRALSAIARALGWTGSPTVGLVLAIMTCVGCFIRAAGLPAYPGTLARDESRLALAAQSIIVNRVPVSPGGAIYTRGLLPDYVEAGAFRLLGVSDQAARLPTVIVGTLIVPATYWLARGVGGQWPAVAAATIVALSPPLIALSGEAWLYPWLTLWLVVAAGWLVRAHRDSGSHAYVLAGVAYSAAALSHELAALFLPAVAVTQLFGMRARPIWATVRPFWLIATPATLAALLLTVMLRSPTLAGGSSELQTYLRAPSDLSGLTATLQLIAVSHPWLAPASALGFGMLLLRRRFGAAICLPIFVVLAQLAFNGLILTRHGHPRDIQVLVPFLAVTATYAAQRAAPFVACTLLGWRFTARRFSWLGAGFVLTLVLVSVDIGAVAASARRPNLAPTWLEAMSTYTPKDVVLSYAPTQTSHYLGKTDFWMRPNGYSRYVWSKSPPYRDIYTGAVVIRNVRELELLVLARNSGKTLWVLMQRELPPEQSLALTEMLTRLAPIVIEEPPTGDGTRVLRAQL